MRLLERAEKETGRWSPGTPRPSISSPLHFSTPANKVLNRHSRTSLRATHESLQISKTNSKSESSALERTCLSLDTSSSSNRLYFGSPIFNPVVYSLVVYRLLLSSWGLPSEVLANYHQLGIDRMFEWQADCLCIGNVLGNHFNTGKLCLIS